MKKLLKLKKVKFFERKFNVKMKLTALFLVTSLFQLQANEKYDSNAKFAINFNDKGIQQIITGTVTNSQGESLPGASVVEKGTTNGSQTDFDGNFTLEVANDAVLVISYVGFETQEVSVSGKTIIKVSLKESSGKLDVVVITGIRGAEQRAIAAKKAAVSVVESISPQDLGNFSDENIGDALRRVPGVQIQEDQSGGQDGGSRVSIRGIGAQFVTTTINGRQPLSAGVQGTRGFRQFDVSILPPEILGGATIYKTSEAGLVEPGLGGLVNFETLKPLDVNYKGGKNIFGSLNIRGEFDSQDNDFLTPEARISGIFGGKTKDEKFGAYLSAIYSKVDRRRDQGFTRVGSSTILEDTNGNGVWDGAAGGDTEFADVITPASTTYNAIQENQERLGIASALQWKPVKELTITADVLFSKFDQTSTRPLIRPIGGGTLFNSRVYAPGTLNIAEDGFLESFTTAGAFDTTTGDVDEGTNLQYQNTRFDLLTNTIIGGLNATWESNGWKIVADYSKSDVSFRYDLTVYGRSAQNLANPNIPVAGPISYDGTDFPSWSLDQTSQNAWNEVIASNGVVAPNGFQQLRYLNGQNDAFRLDISKELNDEFSLDFGYRYSQNDYYQATIILNGANLANVTSDENGDRIVVDNGIFDGSIEDFLPGTGFNLVDNWPSLDQEAYFNLFPQIFNVDPSRHPVLQRGVDVLDVPELIAETIANGTDNGYVLNGTPFGIKEGTNAFYSQLNIDTKLGNLPISGNIGLRGVRTEYTASSFSNINLNDPDDEVGGNLQFAFVGNTVNDSRWDFLPSLNLKLKFNPDFHYRFGLVRTMTRPQVTDLLPTGNLTAQNTAITTFTGRNGTATLPNAAINPFSTWQVDNTFEFYNKSGAFFVSFFYKDIKDYIGNDVEEDVTFDEVLEQGGFPTDGIVDAGVLSDFQNQTYVVTRPDNIGDAKIFGLEAGFNQRLSIISDALRNFGLQANYNFVTASFNNTENDIDDAFPGTSEHSFNSVAYFENDKFNVRAAYSIRSNFLRTLSGEGLTNLPQWQEGRGQLDLRAGYKIKPSLTLSLSAQNVTGADQNAIFSNIDTRSFQSISLDPIYTIGLRYGF